MTYKVKEYNSIWRTPHLEKETKYDDWQSAQIAVDEIMKTKDLIDIIVMVTTNDEGKEIEQVIYTKRWVPYWEKETTTKIYS